MMRILSGVIVACSIASQAYAQTANVCWSDAEFVDLTVAAGPAILQAVQNQCASQLAADTVVMQTAGPFAEKIRAAGREAWPRAAPIFIRVARARGGDIPKTDEKMTFDELTTGMQPMLKGVVAKKDCGSANGIATAFVPMPPRNIASVLLEIMHIKHREYVTKGVADPFPLCPR